MTMPIQRCLDPDATCEMRVEAVTTAKDTPSVLWSPDKAKSSVQSIRRIASQMQLPAETKSEVNPPMIEESRPFETAAKTHLFKTFTKSPQGHRAWKGQIASSPLGWEGEAAVSVGEAEVYREGYKKMKEKLRRESELLR